MAEAPARPQDRNRLKGLIHRDRHIRREGQRHVADRGGPAQGRRQGIEAGKTEKEADPGRCAQAAREPDQSLSVLRQEVPVDPGPVVEPLEVGGGDQAQEVPIPGLVPRQDREVPVLLLALAGRPLEPRRGGHVRLDPEDRLDADLGPGLVERQRAEHRAGVGDGQRRHLLLGRPREQRVDPGGPVQQRVFGVVVKVNEAAPGHGSEV